MCSAIYNNCELKLWYCARDEPTIIDFSTPVLQEIFLFLLANRSKINFQPQSGTLFIFVALHCGNYLPRYHKPTLHLHEYTLDTQQVLNVRQ